MFVYGLNLNTGALIGIIVAVLILLIIIGIVGWYKALNQELMFI